MNGLDRIVRRNTLLLAVSMALSWAVIQLDSALAAVMLSHLSGVAAAAGLAPGIYLMGHGLGGLVTGRAMDAWGRRNGLLLAFAVGAVGAFVIYGAAVAGSLPAFLVGLLVTGLGTGGANLARAAGADMYPPARRARGITLVMLGAAFGAIGSPLLFAPLLAGARGHDPAALMAPWPVAAGLMLAGGVVLLAIRTDPREIAERLRRQADVESTADGLAGSAGSPAAIAATVPAASARSLSELLAVPLVPLGLLAAVVSQSVMSATMGLIGLVLVGHGHDLGAVSITMSAHFLGMFGLVLVVGRLVERIGRFRSVIVGLLVLAAGVLLLLPGVSLVNFMPAMLAVGIGWNIAFVASTTILADAARPLERGRLLGFSDWLSITAAAVVSVGAGLVIGTVGLTVLVVLGVLMALVPAIVFAANRQRLEGRPAPGAPAVPGSG